ncbi:magnesium-translocating P-type ATPase [Paeniglutamicibacter psychrophenolicus]|uniref:magnesium-translocating P-type ATPase n=1 Tax=Paeniglutamicibacter psychrophenolicus TaxID=257454 RepID=UPI00278637DB|nr:magnesium-translocating P-type ATPase [Paeniglutamicibacter psychrophenolicus]MDQ0092411.1 Mg2+-importing ATPase [Paeniglutamicibacter psychrophenolicus]
MAASPALSIQDAARRPTERVLLDLDTTKVGLGEPEAARRLAVVGPNALRTHKAQPGAVLWRQLRSPILRLLLATAGLSVFLGDITNSVVIAVILAVSIGLGFSSEFRAERAAEALHKRVTHTVVALRDGKERQLDVVRLVPGDVVRLFLGAIVPADIRLLVCDEMSCDESILTGESLPVRKDPAPVGGEVSVGDMSSCAFMGTVIQFGSCTGVVVATGGRAEFGQIALGLGEGQPQTEFQQGLKRFSYLLLQVAVVLTTLIFIANLLLGRPFIESLLFSLAIAVGITPQLLPAVVSTCLATGTRMLARRNVLVKRLVCIEDLGDMDVLVTDKTGTLTEGRIGFSKALPVLPDLSVAELFLLGLVSTEMDFSGAVVSTEGHNPLDTALWNAPAAREFVPGSWKRVDIVPFDHQRRMSSVLVSDPAGNQRIISKGAPEDLMRLCVDVPPDAHSRLDELYDQGARVVAVATRATVNLPGLGIADERGLRLAGFLTFQDNPKPNAKESLVELAALGITVKIATGDNARVAEKVCRELGLVLGGTLTGIQMDAMTDEHLIVAARDANIFARVSPEQKARLIRLLRQDGSAVGFLGDGVNDALGLHKADVGISVDSATDVAKDAADIVLMDKDLGVLAEGVRDGRRIFANTMKYVLMGTSSNFGNMFSAATASVVLSFLPMLPGQILLNNLLYDTGQLAIPGDNVDKEQMFAPSHWDISLIRRFMLLFGPISSLFDFATFSLMIFAVHAAQGEFRAGWFIESIATQTLIIFAIRTRRVPFLRSRPSMGLLGSALGVVALGIFIPLSPVAGLLGFDPLPAPFFLSLLGLTVVYLVLVEIAKSWFFSRSERRAPTSRKREGPHHVHRRASRFSVAGPLGPGGARVASKQVVRSSADHRAT